MGSLWSKADPSPQAEQKRLEKRYGILFPPSFVNHTNNNSNKNNNKNSWTSSLQAQVQLYELQLQEPSLVDYLWMTHPSTRLLEDFVDSGLTLQIPIQPVASTQDKNRLWIYLPPRPSLHHYYASPSLLFQHKQGLPSVLHVQVHLPTDPSTPASIQAAQNFGSRNPHHQWGLGGRLAANGAGSNDNDSPTTTKVNTSWVEAKYRGQFNLGNPESGYDTVANLFLGSWLALDPKSVLSSLHSTNTATATSRQLSSSSSSSPTLHLQAGMEYQETLVAAHAQIPTSALHHHQQQQLPTAATVTSLVSMNLNPSIATVSDESETGAESAPPLWLTLKHQSTWESLNPASSLSSSSSSWALQLSQIWTFDRVVVNPMEDRAPKIRQTLGWAFQVEPPPRPFATTSQKQQEQSAPQWKAGATYQWNRGLATKILWTDQGRNFQIGGIFKRWMSPRITLSVWKNFHVGGGSQASSSSSSSSPSWRMGLEVESGPYQHDNGSSANQQNTNPNASYPPTNSNLPDPTKSVPPTKVQLPPSQTKLP